MGYFFKENKNSTDYCRIGILFLIKLKVFHPKSIIQFFGQVAKGARNIASGSRNIADGLVDVTEGRGNITEGKKKITEGILKVPRGG